METYVKSFVLIPAVVGKGWKAFCSELSPPFEGERRLEHSLI